MGSYYTYPKSNHRPHTPITNPNHPRHKSILYRRSLSRDDVRMIKRRNRNGTVSPSLVPPIHGFEDYDRKNNLLRHSHGLHFVFLGRIHSGMTIVTSISTICLPKPFPVHDSLMN
jgi:hypothetical protein